MNKRIPTLKEVDIGFDSTGKSLSESKVLTALAKEANNGIKLRKALLFTLKDFSPYVGEFLYNSKCHIESPNLPPSDMIFLTFVGVCEYSHAGRSEKVAWSVAFTYKSIPFAFSLEKFGLRLYRHKNFAPAANLPEEMLRVLAKGMSIVSKLCEPLVLEQVTSGNVTIANSFLQLDNMYSYFREQAKKNFTSKPKPSKPKIEDLAKLLTARYQKRAAGNYNANSMIDAYFSRLEHLLILLLPFVNYDRTKHDLVYLMGAVWSEKFKAVFDVTNDVTAKTLFDRLIVLRERYRNAVAHGNFQKDGKSLFFHFPSGAISCQLSSTVAERFDSILQLDEPAYERICTLFDEVDAFFETGAAKFGYQYANSGLDVAFDVISLGKYKAAMRDEDSFKDFLKYESQIATMRMNMDW
jgi:hypothetical protein